MAGLSNTRMLPPILHEYFHSMCKEKYVIDNEMVLSSISSQILGIMMIQCLYEINFDNVVIVLSG